MIAHGNLGHSMIMITYSHGLKKGRVMYMLQKLTHKKTPSILHNISLVDIFRTFRPVPLLCSMIPPRAEVESVWVTSKLQPGLAYEETWKGTFRNGMYACCGGGLFPNVCLWNPQLSLRSEVPCKFDAGNYFLHSLHKTNL